MGANKLRISEQGDLIAATAVGNVLFRQPFAYQEINSTRVAIAANYAVGRHQTVNSQPGRYPDGKKAIDEVTGEGRIVDHAVIKDGKATTYETMSMRADKGYQALKEQRILDNGGTFIRAKETRKLVPVDGISTLVREK